MSCRRASAAIVSNAREGFPDPDTPVITVSCRSGRSTSMPCGLLVRAPHTLIRSCVIVALRKTVGQCWWVAAVLGSASIATAART